MQIQIEQVTEHAELYHPRPDTDTPNVHVTLDCETGKLSAAALHPAINAKPRNVHNHTAHRWQIPELRADAANALLDEIAPLAQRALDGYERAWDGNNYVGRYSEDAQAALDEINDLTLNASPHDALVVWRADEWFNSVGDDAALAAQCGITAETTDEELAAIIARESDTQTDECDLIVGVEEHLTALRNKLRAEQQ